MSTENGNRPRLFAFGNVAVGIIAVGNVAVGVVAIGFTVAVGPIAIGMNSVGILLGLGLNAVGNVALALINGVGVFTAAGVNGLGAFTMSFVNRGESAFIAALLLLGQVVATIVLKPEKTIETRELPTTTSLSALLSGEAIEGTVLAEMEPKEPNLVAIHAEGQTLSAQLLGSARQTFEAASPKDQRGALLITVRASTEMIEGSNDADYRKAPETTRSFLIERVDVPPRPPRFWEKPGAIKQACRASTATGVLISAAALLLRLFSS